MGKKKTYRILYLVLAVILCSAVMCVVDGVIKPQYLVKSLIKVALFLLVPAIYFAVNRAECTVLRDLLRPRGRCILRALLPALLLYGVIVGGYFLLRGVFDFSGIAGKLTEDTGVNAQNFLWVSLYISLANSFLEEFFFRGVAFTVLGRIIPRRVAFVFSALAFALYHSGMTLGYYHFGVFLLVLFALFAAGAFFNLLCERSRSLYASWFVHMFANFGINTVGFILFSAQ